MSIQREFRNYDDMKGFADLLAKLPGFTDSSWHNDTCPSMEHEESHTKIWVEYADPDNRENAGPRFSIEQGELLGEADCVLATDDAALVVEWVRSNITKLTPDKCGASQLACNIVNNTFLSLDGFAAMRKQMEGTTYTASQFGAELARIVDRELDAKSNAMRHITVYMSDGDTISTNINGTDEEIMRHYLGTRFEAGCDTKHHVALAVHFHDTDKTCGLPIKAIEMGTTHRVKTVRRVTVCVDETKTIEEFMLTTQGGAEFALDDVWVYDMDGNWIEGIGYKHATT